VAAKVRNVIGKAKFSSPIELPDMLHGASKKNEPKKDAYLCSVKRR
jgi:hypothetical protein